MYLKKCQKTHQKLKQQEMRKTEKADSSLLFYHLINSYLFNEFVCKLGFFWYEWARLKF
jgi:hypothetical protein